MIKKCLHLSLEDRKLGLNKDTSVVIGFIMFLSVNLLFIAINFMCPQNDSLLNAYFVMYLLAIFVAFGLIIGGFLFQEKEEKERWSRLFSDLDNLEGTFKELFSQRQEIMDLITEIDNFLLTSMNQPVSGESDAEI